MTRRRVGAVHRERQAAPAEPDDPVRGPNRRPHRVSAWVQGNLKLASDFKRTALTWDRYSSARRSTSFPCSNKRLRRLSSRSSSDSRRVVPGRTPARGDLRRHRSHVNHAVSSPHRCPGYAGGAGPMDPEPRPEALRPRLAGEATPERSRLTAEADGRTVQRVGSVGGGTKSDPQFAFPN